MDDARIEQFRKMAEADPENELGHFSLGRAYLDAGRATEAVACFQRVLSLNDQNSKAYHLLGQAQYEAGETAGAAETLKRGFTVAHQRGDMRARDEMAALLGKLGEEAPAVEARSASAPTPGPAAGSGLIACRRCGQHRPPLAERPFKGPLGEKVLANVCPECWQAWILMGTKVINELRLDFGRPGDANRYDQHMAEFLRLTDVG